MALRINLPIILGILTIISLLTTAGFGIAFHRFKKPVFRFHRFFAFLAIILAIAHATLIILR